jgi:hypothetical protein
MDAQYPFASRDDIWRVFEELKDLQISHIAQGERLAQLERRRDEDARMRSPWGPTSPFPSSVGTAAPGNNPFKAHSSPPLTNPPLQTLPFTLPPTHSKGLTKLTTPPCLPRRWPSTWRRSLGEAPLVLTAFALMRAPFTGMARLIAPAMNCLPGLAVV